MLIAGDPQYPATVAMARALRQSFLPNKVLLFKAAGEEGERLARIAPFVRDMVPAADGPQAYICEQYTCHRPLAEFSELKAFLDGV